MDANTTAKIQELVDISKAIELLCLLNVSDFKSALRTLEGGYLGVLLGDSTNKKVINVEKIASALPRHLLAHIVTGEKNYLLSHPGAPNGWLAYMAKGLHLLNCFITLEYTYPRLAHVQRGMEQRSCVLDLLLLAGTVWNTELAGASSFQHFVLCAEGIRLTSAALGTALQQDLDKGAENNKQANSKEANSLAATNISSVGQKNISKSTSNGTLAVQPYSYEWYDALLVHPKSNLLISLPIDTINLLQNVTSKALQSSPDHIPKLCRSFHTQLEALHLMCCSEEIVVQLLAHPIFVEGELLRVLHQSLDLWKSTWTPSTKQAPLSSSTGVTGGNTANLFQNNDPIASVVHQVLRVLYPVYEQEYVLFEKENPCFLDAVAASAPAFQFMQTIISTVSQMSSVILDPATCGPSALESFRLLEILSDDSNFKNEVISRTTPLLLKLLSFPPSTIEELFTTPPLPASTTPSSTQQLRDFMLVVFRVVGNLHCFNESVCKAEDEGMFLRTTVAEMLAVSPQSGTTNTSKQAHAIHPPNVTTNINFLLYKLTLERNVYHLNTEELELVTSFTQALQQSLPPSASTSTSSTSSSTSNTSTSTSTTNDNTVSTFNHKRKHMDTLEVQ